MLNILCDLNFYRLVQLPQLCFANNTNEIPCDFNRVRTHFSVSVAIIDATVAITTVTMIPATTVFITGFTNTNTASITASLLLLLVLLISTMTFTPSLLVVPLLQPLSLIFLLTPLIMIYYDLVSVLSITAVKVEFMWFSVPNINYRVHFSNKYSPAKIG